MGGSSHPHPYALFDSLRRPRRAVLRSAGGGTCLSLLEPARQPRRPVGASTSDPSSFTDPIDTTGFTKTACGRTYRHCLTKPQIQTLPA